MSFYSGQPYRQDQVSIAPPNLKLLRSVSIDSDVKDCVEHWVSEAERREDILYFSIFLGQELIGQILLPDWKSTDQTNFDALCWTPDNLYES
jgi:hypothetical protein